MQASSLVSQLVAGAIRAPLAIATIRSLTIVWFIVYLLLCGVLLAFVGWGVLTHKETLRFFVLDYVFPSSWHWAAGVVIDRYFVGQEQTVLINAVTTGSLLMTTLLLFPVKELLSASYESRSNLVGDSERYPRGELPLRLQAIEEVKLFVLWLAVQSSIFWIGYHPDAWRRWVASGIGYAFLCFTFAIDFCSPILQRHRGFYSRILKTLASRPLASLAFGVVFAAPPIAAGLLWKHQSSWSLVTAVAIVFTANVVSVAWAVIAGTWLGAYLLPVFVQRRVSRRGTRLVAWVVISGVLVVHLYRFSALSLAIHHKSQILKCEYDVEIGSFDVDAPGLSDVWSDDMRFGVSFTVTIANRTDFDVRIEDNRLELAHDGDVIGQTRLAPLHVPAKDVVRAQVALSARLQPSVLKRGLALLSRKRWTATLWLEIAPGIEFPVYLLTRQ